MSEPLSESLPQFRYHPDPLATGSVVASDGECECCGTARGHAYAGPTYAVDEVEVVCPWCIADGRAATTFDARFTTVDGAPADVPGGVLDEVERRTPGFAGWQQERWLFHCADGAEYLGRVGWDDIRELPTAVAAIVDDGWSPSILEHLSVEGDLVGYLFRCRHCGTHLAYADAS